MAKLYYNQIVNGVINKKTGEPWKLEDVPEKWRAEVAEMLGE